MDLDLDLGSSGTISTDPHIKYFKHILRTSLQLQPATIDKFFAQPDVQSALHSVLLDDADGSHKFRGIVYYLSRSGGLCFELWHTGCKLTTDLSTTTKGVYFYLDGEIKIQRRSLWDATAKPVQSARRATRRLSRIVPSSSSTARAGDTHQTNPVSPRAGLQPHPPPTSSPAPEPFMTPPPAADLMEESSRSRIARGRWVYGELVPGHTVSTLFTLCTMECARATTFQDARYTTQLAERAAKLRVQMEAATGFTQLPLVPACYADSQFERDRTILEVIDIIERSLAHDPFATYDTKEGEAVANFRHYVSLWEKRKINLRMILSRCESCLTLKACLRRQKAAKSSMPAKFLSLVEDVGENVTVATTALKWMRPLLSRSMFYKPPMSPAAPI